MQIGIQTDKDRQADIEQRMRIPYVNNGTATSLLCKD